MLAPGDFDLATSGWFYGIWICLFLIILILVLLLVAKKYTDRNWEEKGSTSFPLVAAVLCVELFILLKYLQCDQPIIFTLLK